MSLHHNIFQTISIVKDVVRDEAHRAINSWLSCAESAQTSGSAQAVAFLLGFILKHLVTGTYWDCTRRRFRTVITGTVWTSNNSWSTVLRAVTS